MKKRVLSGLLAIALIFGSAAALPEGVFETSSTIRASADSYVSGDFFYELSENGKFVMITKYLEKTSKTCTIPDTIEGKPVEIIAHAAFRDHTELEKVVFPKSLRGIANVAFKGCTSLRKLDLPETLTQISESAFEGCTYLESVTIPKGVKTIGKNAFANCECLDSVTIQDGVGGIGVGAFSGCSWLSNITIPGSVKTIAVNAFNKCTNLERVTISDGVEFIGAYAFTDCLSLSRLVIPKSVKTIGKDNTAYPYSEDNPICDKDKCSIACYLGSNALTYAALNGYKIEYISGDYVYKELKDETVEITGYLGKDKTLTIPSELAEKKVSGIGNGAFANMSDLTSVTIPKGVKSIGDSAFAMCYNLKSITIPSGVTSIGNNAFALCESLKSITIPKGVTSIGISMFFRCSSLESVTIPDGVTTIDRDAFMDCSSLKSVTVPKSVTSFGEHALGFIHDENYKPAVNSDFIIECYKDSDAEKYAKDNNIKYEYVSVKHVAAKKATCTTDGNIEYWKYGNKYYSDKELTKQIDESKIVIKATGHKWGEPTWTWDGVKAATAKFVCGNNSKHVETVTAKITSKTTKAATCTTDGKAVYTATVTLDGKTYTDKKTVTIKKLGHKYGEPTWTWDGVKAATAKFVCARDKSHVETVTAKITSKTTAATCEKDGKTVYTATVTFGGKTYTDTKTVTIKKTGHKYGEPTWTWDGTKSATAKFVCANDKSHVKTVAAKITSKTTKATCEKDGKTVYTATVTFNGKTYTDKKTVTIKKLGHKYGEPTWTWNGTKTASAKFVCANDKTHVKTVAAKITSKTTKATCEKDGKTVYTATVTFGGKTYTDTKTVTIKKTGHKFSAWKTTGFDFAKKTSTQTRKCSVCGKTEKQTTKNAVSRLAGDNRYSTAAKLSSTMYKTADTVVLATGLTFNDALVAVPLANAYKAPLLLGTEKHITDQTLAELKRLKAKNVIVVSTNGAIGDNAKAELKALKLNVTYIEGKTNYETAAKVATALQTKTKKAPDTIFFATDSAFADALSASPVAAIKNAPIIYLKNTGSIDSATANYLKTVKGKVKNAYIIGGDGVISDAMMKNVATALGLKSGKTVVRVAGANRYETCVAVNKKFKSMLTGTGICVAKGLDFPDALAGGVYAAKTRQALFLADGKKLQDVQSSYLKGKNASKITVFGGVGAVPDDLVKLIAEASV